MRKLVMNIEIIRPMCSFIGILLCVHPEKRFADSSHIECVVTVFTVFLVYFGTKKNKLLNKKNYLEKKKLELFISELNGIVFEYNQLE